MWGSRRGMNNDHKFYREVEAVPNHRAGTAESSGPAGRHRVLRGGSWNNNDRANLLSSYRNHNMPMG